MDTSYSAVYEFKLRKEQNDNNQNISESESFKSVVYDEILSCSYVRGEEKCRMLILSIPVLKRCLRLEINIRN